MTTTAAPTARPLHEIAREIRHNWPRPYFGAVPYLEALSQLSWVDDPYICEDGRSIVLYFLSNATTWKGEVARRVKAELRSLLKGG
jgi:hypothetical protein